MSVMTFEGIVAENGAIQLLEPLNFPTNTKVYIVVPDAGEIKLPARPRINSPRLANPAQLADFTIEMRDESVQV